MDLNKKPKYETYEEKRRRRRKIQRIFVSFRSVFFFRVLIRVTIH